MVANNATDAAKAGKYVEYFADRHTPTIKAQTEITVDNISYLRNVAKRAAFELMGMSPFMYDDETPDVAYVNVKNLSRGEGSLYTVTFDADGVAVECGCGADARYDTCKHRVCAQTLVGDDVPAFIDEHTSDDGDDGDDDGRRRPDKVSRPHIDTPELLAIAKVRTWHEEHGTKPVTSHHHYSPPKVLPIDDDDDDDVTLTRREGTATTEGTDQVI